MPLVNAMMKPVLVLPLGRPTFDVPLAEQYAGAAFARLDEEGLATTGPRNLLFDAAAAREAIAAIAPAEIAGILLLQVTFTDASMTVEIARAFPGLPLAIWAFPEPRAGGRLRLNSYCGLNLAAHALGRAGIPHGWLYGPPETAGIVPRLREALAVSGMPVSQARPAQQRGTSPDAVAALDAALANRTIGLVGDHPAGFDTCRYEPERVASLLGGGRVKPLPLGDLFTEARAADDASLEAGLADVRATYAGSDAVDQPQLRKSLQLLDGLRALKAGHGLDAFAVRCWPETFTEFGCAICGPMGIMTEAGTPCACEADVMGALTTMLVNAAAGQPGWLVDIVDMDGASDTGVFWHCGSAPLSMRDPEGEVRAQIHSNRKMPLLAEFTLKPGRITMARLTQTRNGLALVLGSGDILRAPMSFTGTSAVVRFDGGAEQAGARLIGEMLEHHVAFAYGEFRDVLEDWAFARGLPVIDLTPVRGVP
jgi:L-fucose isomerase-like protein